MKSIRVRSKVWLEVDGEPLLGDGRYRLLRAVERSGSIMARPASWGSPTARPVHNWPPWRPTPRFFSLPHRWKGRVCRWSVI